MSEAKEKRWVHVLCFNAYFEDALAKYRARTGLGDTYAILNSLNEFWHQTGDMTEEGYEYNKQKYSETLIQHLKKSSPIDNEPLRIKTEKVEVQKSTIEVSKPKKLPDYSKFSDDELLEAYRKAMLSNDVVTPNLIQGEAKKRGYRFRVNDFGNVQVISLKGAGP